jgi:hypothetical protein
MNNELAVMTFRLDSGDAVGRRSVIMSEHAQ